MAFQSNTSVANNSTHEIDKLLIPTNIPGHEKINLFYTPIGGYQAVAVDGDGNDNFTIIDKDGKVKTNKFLLNGDQIVTSVDKVNHPISNLTSFTFIPTSLLNIPQKYDASKFTDDEASYKTTVQTTPEGVKYTTVEATSKVEGYTVTPMLSKFSYIEAPVVIFNSGSISKEPDKNFNVGFDSSWSHPKYGTTWSHINSSVNYAQNETQMAQPLANFVAPTTINKITIAEPFEDSGNFSFQYQQRQIKSYVITVKDRDDNVVKKLNVPNAGDATNTLLNNLPSGGVGTTILNAFEFVGGAMLIAVPGIGEFAETLSLGKALAEAAIAFGISTVAPMTIDLISGLINNHPDAALLALGYTPKDTSESERLINSISCVIASAYGSKRALDKMNEAQTLIGKTIFNNDFQHETHEFITNLIEIFNDKSSKSEFEKFEISKALSIFNNAIPNKVVFWQNYENFLKSNKSNLDKISQFGVAINLPEEVEVPQGGSLELEAVGINNVGAAFHTTLFHWWSRSWGTFNTTDNAQVLLDGSANDLVFNAPVKNN